MTMGSSQVDSDSIYGGIDKRIIKEDYRNFDLITRFWHGTYRGKIWKHNKSVGEIEGDSLEIILQNLRDQVDKIIDERLENRKAKKPTQGEIVDAFKAVENKIPEIQKDVLLKHANAADSCLTINQIQKMADFDSTTEALLAYACIAKRLCDEIGYWPHATSGQDPALSIILEPSPDQGSNLVLNKETVAAIKSLGW